MGDTCVSGADMWTYMDPPIAIERLDVGYKCRRISGFLMRLDNVIFSRFHPPAHRLLNPSQSFMSLHPGDTISTGNPAPRRAGHGGS